METHRDAKYQRAVKRNGEQDDNQKTLTGTPERKEEIIFKEKIDEEVNINENMSLQTENTQVLSRIKEKNSYIDTL